MKLKIKDLRKVIREEIQTKVEEENDPLASEIEKAALDQIDKEMGQKDLKVKVGDKTISIKFNQLFQNKKN